MNIYHQRLVLGCIVLATEMVRLANNLIALLNVTCNYSHDPEVDIAI